MRLISNKPASDQRGDTIIEVLIAMAIASLVLIGAYASTNHNVRGIQDTQEHSQALQLVQTQVEYLGSHKSITGGHCFDTDGTATNTCNFKADGTTDSSHTQPEYNLSIVNNTPLCVNSYQVSADWTSVTGLAANVTVCYRPQVLS